MHDYLSIWYQYQVPGRMSTVSELNLSMKVAQLISSYVEGTVTWYLLKQQSAVDLASYS